MAFNSGWSLFPQQVTYIYNKMSCFLRLVTSPLDLAYHIIKPRDRIVDRGNGFSYLAKNMGKNRSKKLSSKHSQKLMHLKLLQKDNSKNSKSNWRFNW